MKSHNCYIIYNDKKKTYNGYTIDFTRRIKQHSGILKGGAKYTANKGPWKYLLQIECPEFDKHTALSLEWHIKHPTNKKRYIPKYASPLGRIESMALVLANPKFSNYKMRIRVSSEYYESLYNICVDFPNITLDILSDSYTESNTKKYIV